ncbi:MAG: multidrug ABC transporter ATPase [Microbacterium sp.]
MSKTSSGSDVPVRRIDRILAFMSLGLVVLSIVCFFAIMIGSAADARFDTPLWIGVSMIVYAAPILAFAMIFTLLIMNLVRRARANRSDPGAGV